MTALDILLIILFVAICAWAVAQRLLRQLTSLAVLYLATIAAGLLYPYAARYVTAIGGKTPILTQAVMFWVVFLIVTVALEAIFRRGFPDMRLPKLDFLDYALALLPGILCALIIISLIFTSMGYATEGTWGRSLAYLRVAVGYGYERAALRPLLGQFLSLYLTAHRPWFPVPPPLLAYGLP